MTKTLEAIYESSGILRLQEPLDLKEKTHVRVVVQSLDEPGKRRAGYRGCAR